MLDLHDPGVVDDVVLEEGEEGPGQLVLASDHLVQVLLEEALVDHELDEADVEDGLLVQHHADQVGHLQKEIKASHFPQTNSLHFELETWSEMPLE